MLDYHIYYIYLLNMRHKYLPKVKETQHKLQNE